MSELDYASQSRGWEDDEEEDPPFTLREDEGPYVITKGKYKGVAGVRTFGTKLDYQAKVEALKRDIEADPEFKRHATVLAHEYAAIRLEKAELKDKLSEVELRLVAVAQLLAEQYENEAVTTVVTNAGSVRVQPEPKGVVTDKEKHRLWCIKQGLERLMMLPWTTTNKMTRDMAYEGDDAPDGVTVGIVEKIIFIPKEKRNKL